MKTLRGTFILRCWHLPDGTERLAIEHVQSGERATVGTVAAALDWLAGHTATAPVAPVSAADEAIGATSRPDP